MNTWIYVNFANHEILSEKEFQAKVEEKAREMLGDTDYFDRWLNEHYTPAQIWILLPEDKTFLMQCFERSVRRICFDAVADEYEPRTI